MWKMIVIKIQEMADKKNVTLYRIAEDTGINYSTLHQMKKNNVKMVSLEILQKLCDYLKCTPNDLLAIEK